MRLQFHQFTEQSNRDFFEAVKNVYAVLPHFFSVSVLIRTLFAPWKNLKDTKKGEGFSLNDYFSRLSFNYISSGIGFFLRSSLLFGFVFTLFTLTLMLPLLMLVHLVLLPMSYLLYTLHPSPEEYESQMRTTFVHDHAMLPQNVPVVESWFHVYYKTHLEKHKWWEKKRLMATPPLARDWNTGYTPNLNTYAHTMSPNAQHTWRFVGRQKELSRLEQVLARSNQSNAIVVGADGSGRHTILEAFSKRMWEGTIATSLAYKRMVMLDMESILSAKKTLPEQEHLLEELLVEAKTSRDVVIVIDEIERYTTTSDGHVDLSSVMAKTADDGELQIIGLSTPFTYEKFLRNNEHVQRAFVKIDVEEVDERDALTILMEHSIDFEKRYSVVIPYEALLEAVQKSNFYVTNVPLPEKALDLLDETCVRVSQAKGVKAKIVTPDDIDHTLEEKTHIPVHVSDEFKSKLLTIDTVLKQAVVGQDEGISKVASVIRKSYVERGTRSKPMASLLLLGPTGVGKTETAKAVAQALFDSKEQLIRLDMSFFQTTADIEKLVGAGSQGNPGIFTTLVREKPYSVLLLDEFEKANGKLLNIFLTVLDEGYFIDGYGAKVDCRNLIVIATSNAGADALFLKAASPTSAVTNEAELIATLVENHLFTPELLNRFDGIIAFTALSRDALSHIAQTIIRSIADTVYKTHSVRISVSADRVDSLVTKGYSPQFGARNLDRAIRSELEDEIAKHLLSQKPNPGTIIQL